MCGRHAGDNTTRWDCSCSRTVSESRCRLLWSKDPKFSFLSRFCKKCSRTFLPFITGAGPPRLFRLTITSDCSRSQWWNKGGLCAGMNEIIGQKWGKSSVSLCMTAVERNSLYGWTLSPLKRCRFIKWDLWMVLPSCNFFTSDDPTHL